LSDITPVKSATIGKRKKADEKKASANWQNLKGLVELANGGERTKNDSWDSLPPSQPPLTLSRELRLGKPCPFA
jgi:hypothetical protein